MSETTICGTNIERMGAKEQELAESAAKSDSQDPDVPLSQWKVAWKALTAETYDLNFLRL
jgi:hypothetical protein